MNFNIIQIISNIGFCIYTMLLGGMMRAFGVGRFFFGRAVHQNVVSYQPFTMSEGMSCSFAGWVQGVLVIERDGAGDVK